MENDDQKHKATFHHPPNANQMQEIHINDATVRENLANVLHNLTAMRRLHETSLKSVSEENFTTTCAETLATMSSSQNETTGGGNEMLTGEDKKESLVSSPMMMELSACPIGRTMFAQQQSTQHQKQQSMVTSSSSSSIASSMEASRKTKTLSFLHNEDLFTSGTSAMVSGGNSSSNSLFNDDKLVPTASHLFRSISFQESRRQKSTSLQRTESGKEGGDVMRKMAILSPKHSMQELTEKIKQQQMRVQQQMFYGSSELSM
jgi:hypothetical protein